MVIAGRTNAGKSTLFNRLLREERAIVSELPGTTRDYLEGGAEVGGVPLRLLDTAGLRATADPLEAEGVRRSEHLARNADLVLYVVDAGGGARAGGRGLPGRGAEARAAGPACPGLEQGRPDPAPGASGVRGGERGARGRAGGAGPGDRGAGPRGCGRRRRGRRRR